MDKCIYFHGRTSEGQRFTAACNYDDPNFSSQPKIDVGVSLCSKLDNFERREGRILATERLESPNESKGKNSLVFDEDILKDVDVSRIKLFRVVMGAYSKHSTKTFKEHFNL